MNNKFKGLYDTEGTSFISDKVEPINYYEPTIKTAKIQVSNYSINFDKTKLYKQIEKLQQELQRKDNIIKSLISYLETQINDYKEMGYNQSKIREKDLWMAGQYDEDIFILDKIKELESMEYKI